MIMQISSGMGPVECRVAVGGIFQSLQKEYPEILLDFLCKNHISPKKGNMVIFFALYNI